MDGVGKPPFRQPPSRLPRPLERARDEREEVTGRESVKPRGTGAVDKKGPTVETSTRSGCGKEVYGKGTRYY